VLRERWREIETEVAALNDEAAVQQHLATHLARLLELQAREQAEAVRGGRASPEELAEPARFPDEAVDRQPQGAARHRLATRGCQGTTRGRQARLRPRRGERAQRATWWSRSRPARRRRSSSSNTSSSGAGWRPRYELRTAQDARSVELGYRAQVWRNTAEDWTAVELALSTARPQLGAQGPELQPLWLSLEEKHTRGQPEVLSEVAYDKASAAGEDRAQLDAVVVENQGLSVHFQLATRETSNLTWPEPSEVRIGIRAKLDVSPEYFANARARRQRLAARTHAQHERLGHAARTAAVYFGADYLGTCQLGAVQPGEELVLHLGPDPALSIERTLPRGRDRRPRHLRRRRLAQAALSASASRTTALLRRAPTAAHWSSCAKRCHARPTSA
jgi:hypothetical protein